MKGIKYAALAVVAASLSIGLASAQEIAGKFNLPFTVHWGEVVLTPGQYSFTQLETDDGVPIIAVRRGTRTLGPIMPHEAQSEGRFSAPSHLTAEAMAGGYRITSLVLSEQGFKLRFATPKGEVLEASQTTRSVHSVPVLQASK